VGLFEGFLHPLLLWGTALAAVPLLIHLLNRRRYRPLAWGAMRFVLAAEKRMRRRVQLENWLLLLLRMAAVAVLALCIARPFVGTESPLAALTERRRDLALVLDRSASTGYRDVRAVHEAILERARSLLAQLDGTRGDRVRLWCAAESVQLLSSHSPEDALAALTTLDGPADEPFDLAAVLAELLTFAREDAGQSGHSALEVHLLTDLQRHSFVREPAATPRGGTGHSLSEMLDELRNLGVTVWVEDLGDPTPIPANVGIEWIEPTTAILGPGVPSEIGVRVHNFGPSARGGLRVALTLDGQRLPSQKVDVGARASAQVNFAVTFAEPGHHALEAELEGDRLACDDRRAQVLDVPAPLSVLLVNGAPSDDLARDELGVLRAALEPPDDEVVIRSPQGRYAPFQCEEVSPAALGAHEKPLESYDVIVLANVAGVPGPEVEALERWVARGGCLLVTLGDRTADASAMDTLNDRLWRADESGLLPARLVRPSAAAEGEYFRAAVFAADHPALAFFSDERWKPYLTELPIYQFIATEPLASARALVRLDDEAHSALLLERAYERGHVFLWTTTIDGDWNAFPRSPATLIPLFHELLRYGGTGLVPPRNTTVGGTLALELDAFPRATALVRPDGARTQLALEPRELVEGLWQLGPLGPLDRAGLWRVESEGAGNHWLACQLASEEGDLARLSGDELEALSPVLKLFRADAEDGASDENPLERGEFWRWLAALTLGLLVAETLWAAWIGRGRRQA
jgi:hypothetical protein